MPQQTINIKTKEQGRVWLLPPYNYSLRRIANELSIGQLYIMWTSWY